MRQKQNQRQTQKKKQEQKQNKWIKKGDRVLVLAGNDRGRVGTVLRREIDRAVVQGMNIRKKHAKRKTQVQTPTVIEVEMPIHVSKLSLCNDDGKAVRVKARSTKKERELFYVQDGKEVALRTLRKY